jgi:AraC-like DNA-binding protein
LQGNDFVLNHNTSDFMLHAFSIGIAFFIAILLISKEYRTTADTVLSAWMLVAGVHLWMYDFAITKGFSEMPVLAGLSHPLPLMHGPFLLCYTVVMTEQLPSRKWRIFLHWLVPLLVMLYALPFLFLTKADQIAILDGTSQEYMFFAEYRMLRTVAIYASMVGYPLWTFFLVQRHKRRIVNEFSSTDKITLSWLQYLIAGFGVIAVFVVLRNENLIFSGTAVMIMFIGFFGVRQVGIFNHAPANALLPEHAPMPDNIKPSEAFVEHENFNPNRQETPVIDGEREQAALEVSQKKKYAKSGITPEVASELHQALTKLMQREKLYTESELSLADLASCLDIHPNYLSQVINEQEGKNFYDYVNTLRIEEFKRLAALPENQHLTLLALAFECGFNSKSSFNRYFKKVTNTSPSEYLSNLRNSTT